MRVKKQEPFGMVFNIQRFSLDDGPGIRTTLFLKGCSYHCLWCHNPESINAKKEVLFYEERCCGCGTCLAVCPQQIRRLVDRIVEFDRERCTGCGCCALACCSGAISICGENINVEALVERLVRDRPFYLQSGGGVTFSGGEPMLQHKFVGMVAAELKQKGVHTALDTAGNVPQEWYDEIFSNIDLYLYDIKAADPMLHRTLTGTTNEQSLRNLRMLSERGSRIWIRIPFIPNMTCGVDEVKKMSEIISELKGIERIELVPYHAYGENKYKELGRMLDGRLRTPKQSEIRNCLEQFSEYGVAVEYAQGGEV